MRVRKKMIVVRVTAKEAKALKRFARSEGKTLAALVRERLIAPALQWDPAQGILDDIFAEMNRP